MPDMDFPEWNREKPVESVDACFRWLTSKAEEQIQWYEERRLPQKCWSQRTRWIALFFAAIGGICPLVSPMAIFKGFNLAEWGYVFLALGAFTVTFDRMYGFSSSWMRYASTQLNLDIALREFRFEWAQLQSQPHAPEAALQKLKDFSAKVDGIVKQETEAWINEFRSNLAELEKALKTGTEERKPGGVQLKVTNARAFKKISIYLNNALRRELEGVSEILIDMVAPGTHEMLLTAIDADGGEHHESKVVEVRANTTASLEVTIP